MDSNIQLFRENGNILNKCMTSQVSSSVVGLEPIIRQSMRVSPTDAVTEQHREQYGNSHGTEGCAPP